MDSIDDQVSSAPENNPVYRLAMVVLLLVIAAASFFPETYIIEFPLIGSARTFPLTLLLPLLVIAALVMVIREGGTLGFKAVDAVVIAFSFYLLARNIAGDDQFFAVKYVLIGLGVYYLTAALAVSNGWLRRLFFSVSAVLMVTAVYGLIEFAVQENFIFQPYISVGEPQNVTHRVGSLLGHPVVYGAFIVQTIPFAIFLWVRGWRRWLRFFGLAASLMAIACLLLTASKGSWIAAFVVGIIATAYFARTRGKRSITIALVAVIFVAIVAGLYSSGSSLDDIIRFRTSVDVRTTAWEAALTGISENPVFGVGLRQGQQEVINNIPEWWKELSGFYPPADNYFLNVFLEGGVIGGLIWSAMIVLIVVCGYRQVTKDRQVRFMLMAAYLGIIGLLVNMVTFDAMLIWPNVVMFWVSAGILRSRYGRETG